MNTYRLSPLQHYYLEALGRYGNCFFYIEGADPERQLEACWMNSGISGDVSWSDVRHVVMNAMATPSNAPVADRGSSAVPHR